MSLSKGKCPNCGEFIEVDSQEFNVICRFCGVPFFPQEAIENYQNYLSQLGNNLNIDTINVNADNISNYATLGLTALKEKNHEKCGFYADDILKRMPSSPEGLLLKAYFISDNYSKEEGIRYYFLAYANANNKELKELIIATLKEDMEEYSSGNFTYLLEEMKKLDDETYRNLLSYVLTYISSELENEALINTIKFNLADIETSFKKTREVLWTEEEYQLSKIDSNLIYSKNDVVRAFISLDEVDKQVEKYQNKKTKVHQFSYYFYLKERIIAINLKQENESLEKVISTASKELVSIHSGCYVATCVYGSYNAPEVWVLRRYRDQKLSSSLLGRIFIKLYYLISPTMVRLFGNNKVFKSFNYKILNFIVHKLINRGYSPSPYRDNRK